MPRRQCHGVEQPVMPNPPYEFSAVPNCVITEDGLEGSVLEEVVTRSEWVSAVPELVGLSHEAADRRACKTGSFHGIHHDHAEAERLSFSFIAERAHTDDPIEGYMIRTKDKSRKLQGFLWFTNFTTWTHFFRWDSLAAKAELHGRAQRDGISWDSDGSLTAEMELQFREGDPNDQGVIWPRVAEIALVGALECGGFLVQLALEALENSTAYDFVVVQATESSAGFYDRMGFKRVGALAKYVTSDVAPHQARTVAYRHWAYPDEDVSKMDSSIMMALKLRAGALVRRIMPDLGGILPNRARFMHRLPAAARGVLSRKMDNLTPSKAAYIDAATAAVAAAAEASGAWRCDPQLRLLIEASPVAVAEGAGGGKEPSRRSQACRPWMCYGNPSTVCLTPKRAREPASNQLNQLSRSSSSLVQQKARTSPDADSPHPPAAASRAIKGPALTSSPKRKGASTLDSSAAAAAAAAEVKEPVGTTSEAEAAGRLTPQPSTPAGDGNGSLNGAKRPRRESAMRSTDFASMVGRRFHSKGMQKKQDLLVRKTAAGKNPLRDCGKQAGRLVMTESDERIRMAAQRVSRRLSPAAKGVSENIGVGIQKCRSLGSASVDLLCRKDGPSGADIAKAVTADWVSPSLNTLEQGEKSSQTQTVEDHQPKASVSNGVSPTLSKKKKSVAARAQCLVSVLAGRLRRQRAQARMFKFSRLALHSQVVMPLGKRKDRPSTLSTSDLRALCHPGVKSWKQRNASSVLVKKQRTVKRGDTCKNVPRAVPTCALFPAYPFVCEDDGIIAEFAQQNFRCPFTIVDGVIHATAGYAAVAPYDGGRILLHTDDLQPGANGENEADTCKQAVEKADAVALWDKLSCDGCSRTDQEDQMILCDSCDSGWHIHCLTPPLASIPEEDWFCQRCASKQTNKRLPAADNSVGREMRRPASEMAASSAECLNEEGEGSDARPTRQRVPVARFKFGRDGGSGSRTVSKQAAGGVSTYDDDSEDDDVSKEGEEEEEADEVARAAVLVVPSGMDEHLKPTDHDGFWRDLKSATLRCVCQDLALRFDGSQNMLVEKIISRLGKAVPNGEDLKLFRMFTLRSICSDTALTVRGSKDEISSRLVRFLSSTTSSSVSSVDSSDESADPHCVPSFPAGNSQLNQVWQQWPCDGCGCSDREEQMILCDECDAGWHLDCLTPALPSVPDGNWFCPGCLVRRRRNAQRSAGGNASNCADSGKIVTSSRRSKAGEKQLCPNDAAAYGQDGRAERRQRAPVLRFRFSSVEVKI